MNVGSIFQPIFAALFCANFKEQTADTSGASPRMCLGEPICSFPQCCLAAFLKRSILSAFECQWVKEGGQIGNQPLIILQLANHFQHSDVVCSS